MDGPFAGRPSLSIAQDVPSECVNGARFAGPTSRARGVVLMMNCLLTEGDTRGDVETGDRHPIACEIEELGFFDRGDDLT